jgi:hypothetical protein
VRASGRQDVLALTRGGFHTGLWNSQWSVLGRQRTSTDLVLDNWELALLVITWLAIGALPIRRQIDWRRRRFTQQVDFSLTTPVERDGSATLLLRTLLEDSAANASLNPRNGEHAAPRGRSKVARYCEYPTANQVD